MMHLYYSRQPQCSANCTNFGTTKHIQAHTIHWSIVHETFTYIQVHASPATDITLSFHIHSHIMHVDYRHLLGHFATIICCVSQLWEVRSGVNVVVWINEAFGRRNDLQGIRTRLLHHEWYNRLTRYPLCHSAPKDSWITIYCVHCQKYIVVWKLRQETVFLH